MHKRVFYIINLDRKRLLILSFTLFAGLLFAFTAGFRMGHGERKRPDTLAGLTRRPGSQNTADQDRTEISPDDPGSEKAQSEIGYSRFERKGDPNDQTRLRNTGSKANDDFGQNLKRESTTANTGNRNTTGEHERPLEYAPQKYRPEPRTRQTHTQGQSKVPRQPRQTSQRKKKSHKPARTAQKKSNKSKKNSRQATAQKNSSQKKLHKRKANTALLKSKGNGIQLSNPGSNSRQSATNSHNPIALKSNSKITNNSLSNHKKHSAVFALQTGSFRSKAAATRMEKGLQKQGFKARIVRRRKNYVVQVGHSSNPRELWNIENKLRKKRYSSMRVQISK